MSLLKAMLISLLLLPFTLSYAGERGQQQQHQQQLESAMSLLLEGAASDLPSLAGSGITLTLVSAPGSAWRSQAVKFSVAATKDLTSFSVILVQNLDQFCARRRSNEKIFTLSVFLDVYDNSTDLWRQFATCLSSVTNSSRFHRHTVSFIQDDNEDDDQGEYFSDFLDVLTESTTVSSAIFLVRMARSTNSTAGRLYEVYRTSSEAAAAVVVQPVATSANNTVSMVKDQYIWKRRRDLANHTFWAISQTWSPFITHMTSPPSEVVVKGLYADIMDVLAARLNFSVKLVPNSEESWSHLVSEVSSKRVDLGLTGFSHTYARVDLVDFSVPLTASSIRLFYSRQEERSPLDVYLGSFLRDSWISIGSSMCSLVLGLFSIGWLRRRLTSLNQSLAYGTPVKKDDKVSYERFFSLGSAASFVVLAYLGRRFPKEPLANSLRLAFATVSLSGFILISLYRAMLGASLAIRIHNPPIRSLEELTHSDDHDIIIMNGTSVFRYFSDAKEGSPQKRLYAEKILKSPFNELEMIEREGMESIANGTNPTAILIAVFQPLTTNPAYPCSVVSLDQDLRPRGNGLVFQKNWPYTDLFNYHLLKMQEQGLTDELRNKWVRIRDFTTCALDDYGGKRRIEATLDHVMTLFMLWAAGVTVSVGFCFVEWILWIRTRTYTG